MSKEFPTPSLAQPRKKRKTLLVLVIVFVCLIGGAAGAYYWFNRPIEPTVLAAAEQAALEKKVEAVQEPTYTPGGKTIVLTEREVNALLHQNTDLGDKLKIEFASNAVHARVHMDLDPDLPVLGGKTLKAKARFFIQQEQGSSSIILDDVTVWGISLPNAWLADLKGKNLISNLGLSRQDRATNGSANSGIEEISVKSGELVIRLAE